MTSADPTPIIAALDIQPTYSAREAAVLLGRSYSWLDQRLRKTSSSCLTAPPCSRYGQQGGYRRFTLAMLEDIALSSYRHHWFSMNKLKSACQRSLGCSAANWTSPKTVEACTMRSSHARNAQEVRPGVQGGCGPHRPGDVMNRWPGSSDGFR